VLGDAPAVDFASFDDDTVISEEQAFGHTDSTEKVCDESSAQVLADVIKGNGEQEVL
jgi:hypothetical protein